MTNANYQIWLIHPTTGDVIDIIHPTASFSMKFSNQLREIGRFAMTLPPTKDWISFVPLDTQVEIFRQRPGDGTMDRLGVWLVRSWDRFREGSDERFVIGGFHANDLLDRRIIDPDDDPSASGGYSTKAGSAGDVIREYIREQCVLSSGSRAFPNFSVPTPTDSGATLGATFRFENLFKEMRKLAIRGGIDFEVRRDESAGGSALEVIIGIIGEQRSRATNNFPPYLIFNPDRGNIQKPELTIDHRKEKTIAYALGDGEGVNRAVIQVPSGRENASSYNRIEVKIDARSADTTNPTAVVTEAVGRLAELNPEQELKFELIPGVGGAGFIDDWDFGDTATVRWGDVELNLRITEIEIELVGLQEMIKPKVAIL